MEAAQHNDYEVEINYNGVVKPFKVTVSELVKALLEKAIRVFGISQNMHLLALFTPSNEELADSKTIGSAGVHPNERLNLRPSAMRGGCGQ
jgi:hypothetical protein